MVYVEGGFIKCEEDRVNGNAPAFSASAVYGEKKTN